MANNSKISTKRTITITLNHWTQDRLRYLILENQILALNRHQNVAGHLQKSVILVSINSSFHINSNKFGIFNFARSAFVTWLK